MRAVTNADDNDNDDDDDDDDNAGRHSTNTMAIYDISPIRNYWTSQIQSSASTKLLRAVQMHQYTLWSIKTCHFYFSDNSGK